MWFSQNLPINYLQGFIWYFFHWINWVGSGLELFTSLRIQFICWKSINTLKEIYFFLTKINFFFWSLEFFFNILLLQKSCISKNSNIFFTRICKSWVFSKLIFQKNEEKKLTLELEEKNYWFLFNLHSIFKRRLSSLFSSVEPSHFTNEAWNKRNQIIREKFCI